MMIEAQPLTHWFAEVHGLIVRANVKGIDELLIGADVRSVCEERGIKPADLAECLEVPLEIAYAIASGWKPLSTQSLFMVASMLGVPVGAFFHDDEFVRRPRVTMYQGWRHMDHAGFPWI